jgi:K+-transporting ATPase ATPase C chain
MNAVLSHTMTGVRLAVITLIVCSVAYPLVVWGFAQGFFRDSANGSLIYREDGSIAGSALLGQGFTKPGYFWPRPSAVDYDASSAGGSNLSPLNPILKDRVTAFEAQHGPHKEAIPADLVTASGGGMDPHISIEGALFQVERVAKARGVETTALVETIESMAFVPGGFFKKGRIVNVLELNRKLDGLN